MESTLQRPEVCRDGKHEPVWDPSLGKTVCARCGHSGARIVNFYRHDLY